jgi:hypothetical protein
MADNAVPVVNKRHFVNGNPLLLPSKKPKNQMMYSLPVMDILETFAQLEFIKTFSTRLFAVCIVYIDVLRITRCNKCKEKIIELTFIPIRVQRYATNHAFQKFIRCKITSIVQTIELR